MRPAAAFAPFTAIFAALFTIPSTSSAQWIPTGDGGDARKPVVTVEATGMTGVVFTVEFSGAEAEVVDTERGRFVRMSVPGAGVSTAIGEPLLPVLREHVEIPQGATVSLSVVDSEYRSMKVEDLGAGRIYPAQPSVPKIPGAAESMDFEYDEAAYARDALEGETAAALGEIGQVRAHRFAEVEIFPVAHNPVTGEVRLLRSVTVELAFEGGDQEATRAHIERYSSIGFDRFASRNFINSEAFVPITKASVPLPMGYLIVTYDQYADEVFPFAMLKHAMGYNVTVVNTSDIGSATATGIAAYIKDAYDNWDIPPTFVLLVGDTDQIPCFESSDGWDTIATDLFFATMDGSSDWQPDLYIGRFSGDSEAEIASLAGKTVDYTLFDMGTGAGWIKDATFMASEDNNDISEGTHNYVIDTWLDPDGFNCSKRYTVAYGATTNQVIGDIEAGLSQLTYSGHGAFDGWYDGPPLESAQVNILGNEGMYPVVQSYACDTGAYLEDCFAETWTTTTNAGVFFFGSSVSSLWDEDDILERGAYDAWFGVDPYTWLRGALNEGLWDVYEHYSGGGNTESYFQQYNAFGDPSLDPWTAAPRELTLEYDEEVSEGCSIFEATVLDPSSQPVVGALVCAKSGSDIYRTAYSGPDGQVSMDLAAALAVGDSLDVAVSKHNFIPLFATVTVPDPGGPDSDTDVDTDADSDADGDTDSDTDTDGGLGTTTFNPGSSGCGCDQAGAASGEGLLAGMIRVALF